MHWFSGGVAVIENATLCTISGIVSIAALVSLLFWLQRIASDVNGTLPKNERVEWSFGEMVPPFKIHGIWNKHVRLYPESLKRIYAAVSLLLMFLAPIAALLSSIVRG
jgi:hypothetical protein